MKNKIFVLACLVLSAVVAYAATTTPNMLLSIPQINDVDYPTSISNSLTLIDQHDHSANKGVQIPEGGLLNDAVSASKLRDDASVDANRAVTTNHIRDLNVTNAKIADGTIEKTKLAPLGQLCTGTVGFSHTGIGVVDVPGASIAITTTGRPVMITIQPFNGTNAYWYMFVASGNTTFEGSVSIAKGASVIGGVNLRQVDNTAPVAFNVSSNPLMMVIDTPVAGVNTYKLQMGSINSADWLLSNVKLCVWEL